MQSFKTYIITRKTLIKFGIISGIILITAIAVLSHNLLTEKVEPTVTAFSEFASEIINEGTISQERGLTLNELENKILGFDKKDAYSIMKSSSASFEASDVNLSTQEPPENTPSPIPSSLSLLSKDEIVNPQGLKIKNDTDYTIDINELCKLPLETKPEYNGPEVLIVHTHTTECFNGDEMTGETGRTTNEAYNMCAIGEIIANTLEKNGISVVHDKTIHDYPSFQSAYSKALKTIEKNLTENPTIKVVLDIHRDGYIYPDGSKLTVSTEINGESVAQVMLVLGTDSMGLSHSNWKSNLTFAAKIQNAAQKMYPNLMRPLNLRRERFNMHITKGSLLLEIGGNGNTLSQAKKSAEYIANAIAAVLING